MFQPQYGVMGERRATGTSPSPIRVGPYSELITGDSYGRFSELNRVGRLWTLSTGSAGVTVAAVNQTPLTAGTGKPIVGIWNNTSNKLAVVMKSKFHTQSGTPPALSTPMWNYGTAAVITGTKAGSVLSNALSGASSSMTPFMNAALTGSATGIELGAAGAAAFAGAIAANHDAPNVDELAGFIFVPPGAWCGIGAGNGAFGTSWLVYAEMSWAEFDWPLI